MRIWLTFWILISSMWVSAQQADSLYTNPQERPIYPTGDPGMYEDIINRLTIDIDPMYWRQVNQGNYQAIIAFVVDTDGMVDTVWHDRRSVDFFLQDYIHQAIYNLQPFTPGKENGIAINTLVYMDLYLVRDGLSFQLDYQPLYPNSAVLANTSFDKKWTKWALLGVLATIGIFALLIGLGNPNR